MPFDPEKPQPLAEAISSLSRKTPVGAALSSSQWSEQPAALRESAMFSAKVTSVQAMQEVKDRLGKVLAMARDAQTGAYEMDRSKFIAEIQKLSNRLGLRNTDPDKRGSVQDFGSERRLKLIYEQQIGQAQGRAFWLQGMDPDVLDGWPAQELVRVQDRKKKRNWQRRWQDAADAVNYAGVSRAAMAAHRYIALKTSPIWVVLSRFNRPFPPFDYNSGMGVEEISREGAEKWGDLIQPGEPVPTRFDGKLSPATPQGYREQLEASAAGLDPDLRAALQNTFGDQLAIEGDRVVWKGSAEAATFEPPSPSLASDAVAVSPQPEQAQPAAAPLPDADPKFASVDEARAYFKTNFGVQHIETSTSRGRLWGAKMGKAAVLEHLETVASEFRRMLRDFPNCPKDLDTFYAVASPRGRATLDGGSGSRMSVKAEEWSPESWAQIERWEKTNGKAWGSERQGSQVRDNFRHEYGHTLSTPSLLAEWRPIWDKYGADWFRKNVTEYAGSKMVESFADAFGIFTRADYVKGTLPADIEGFMLKVLKV